MSVLPMTTILVLQDCGWMEDKPLNLNIGRVHLSTQNEVRMGVKDGDIRYFQGRIAAMQLYNVALTAEQINAVKKVGLGNYS